MEALANHYRERTVALLAMLYDPSRAASICSYCLPEEADGLAGRIKSLADIEIGERKNVLREKLDGMRVAEDVVLLGEVHPAWFTQVLEKESPRIVGLLLRYLPSKHVRYLMEHLPAELRGRLPSIVDTFGVSPAILKLVRCFFEAHFVPIRPLKPVESFGFHDIVNLRADELEALVHDLGIQELAHAFRDLDRRAIQVVLNRLQFRDAKALKERIEGLSDGFEGIERDAKYTIFEIGVEEGGPAAVLNEVGIHCLAKALLGLQIELVEVVKQKLAPRLGYLLLRCVERYRGRTYPALTAQRRKMILDRLRALSSSGLLDPQWKHLLLETAKSHAGGMAVTATQIVSPEGLETQAPA